MPIKTNTIETQRLILKEVTPEIWNEVFTNYDEDEIASFLGLKTQEDRELERAKWEKGLTTYWVSFKTFLLVEKETGNVIGRCGFHNWYAAHQRAELGYAIKEESAMQKGYMTEALAVIIPFGFEQLKLHRIEAYIGPDNIASQKLVQGRGFILEGTLRENYCHNGKLEDSLCFALLKNEYFALKGQSI